MREEDVAMLLNDMAELYGYVFRGYSGASFKRRIQRVFDLGKAPSFAEFRYRIQHDPDYFSHVVEQITVNVTEMLRDPFFYKIIPEKVLPVLATHPFIR